MSHQFSEGMETPLPLADSDDSFLASVTRLKEVMDAVNNAQSTDRRLSLTV